jgi:hypothetical protein
VFAQRYKRTQAKNKSIDNNQAVEPVDYDKLSLKQQLAQTILGKNTKTKFDMRFKPEVRKSL